MGGALEVWGVWPVAMSYSILLTRSQCELPFVIQFLIFMDRISEAEVSEGFHLGGVRISSLLFTDDMVLLASSGGGLQVALECGLQTSVKQWE